MSKDNEGIIKIKRSEIEDIIENYMQKRCVMDINKLTDRIWEYIQERVKKMVGKPYIARICEEK